MSVLSVICCCRLNKERDEADAGPARSEKELPHECFDDVYFSCGKNGTVMPKGREPWPKNVKA